MVTWPNDASGPSGRASTPTLSSAATAGPGQFRPNGAGYFEFCRRLAPVLDGRGEVTVRPEEVIEPVRTIGVLHAGHHRWDRYGGHAFGPGADHWGGI